MGFESCLGALARQSRSSLAGFELSEAVKVAVVAGLEREIRPLVKHWQVAKRQYDGHQFDFLERDDVVLVCGGIGAEAARRATEAIIALYHPDLIQSVGFAGALGTLRAGNIFIPASVIDMQDGSRLETGVGEGNLLTISAIAGSRQKAKLAAAYDAIAVDMEAAAVGRAAELHGIRWMAVKAISDEADFELPEMAQFINHRGEFRATAFVAFVAFRPWLWARVARLARNSSKASRALGMWLERHNCDSEKLRNLGLESHPMEGKPSTASK